MLKYVKIKSYDILLFINNLTDSAMLCVISFIFYYSCPKIESYGLWDTKSPPFGELHPNHKRKHHEGTKIFDT